jgi:hypothetical protein
VSPDYNEMFEKIMVKHDLDIIKASLGNVDVTEKIKELYSKGIYVIDGSNSVFVDPLTGAIKNLEI